MKNKILLIVAILISTGVFAQSKTSFGVRAGLTSASMRGDAVNSLNNLLNFADGMVTTKSTTGFFAGAYTSIPLGDIFYVEPGLYYSQKGYELNGSLNVKAVEFLGARAKAKLLSQYIDIPVLLKANIGGLQLFAGPQFSYLAKADLQTTAGVLGINLLNTKLDATNQFNRWDAGITGGIGYSFNNGLNLTAAYDYGLSKVDANQSISSYNNVFKVGIGVNF